MTVRGKIEIMNPKIQSQTHILMIQSQTLLFSPILQATQMHILSPYSPGAGTLQYTESCLSTVSTSGTPIVSKWHLVSHLLSRMIGTMNCAKVLRCVDDGQTCGNELMM